MAGSPLTSAAFADALDPRFQRIWVDTLNELPDMVPQFYQMMGSNGRDEVKFSNTGAFGDPSEFTGTVDYDQVFQGFDTTVTPIEFTSGFQVERKFFDDNQIPGFFDQKPAGLARSVVRKKQKDGARLFNNAFVVDTKFYNNTEGNPMVTDTHTTTATGVSTASGFDNLATAALTAAAVIAARKQHVKLRDDRGNLISIVPDTLLVPIELFDVAQEIVDSTGKPAVDTNDINVLKGRLNVVEWVYLTDTNNWFMYDSQLGKEFGSIWTDRITPEFAFAEDLDTLIAKWRVYYRYAYGWVDWRWILGSEVA